MPHGTSEETQHKLSGPYTPNGTLAKDAKENICSLIGPVGGMTKVIEQGGSSLLSQIFKNYPFKTRSKMERRFSCVIRS